MQSRRLLLAAVEPLLPVEDKNKRNICPHTNTCTVTRRFRCYLMIDLPKYLFDCLATLSSAVRSALSLSLFLTLLQCSLAAVRLTFRTACGQQFKPLNWYISQITFTRFPKRRTLDGLAAYGTSVNLSGKLSFLYSKRTANSSIYKFESRPAKIVSAGQAGRRREALVTRDKV